MPDQGGIFRMHSEGRYHGSWDWAEVIIRSLMPFTERRKKKKKERKAKLRVKGLLY